MRRLAVILALMALAVPAIPQQQPPFREEVDVNVVLLDVIVTDSKGNHILGLGKDDFVVRENGVEQAVDSVDYFTNRKLLESREEQAPFKVEQVREDRYFIFFFDKPTDPSVLMDQLMFAREAVKDFMANEMKENDRVAIVGHDFRLKVYTDFTSDRKQIERALNDATRFGNGTTTAPQSGPSILRNVKRKEMVDRTGTVYQALDVLADSVRPIRARKNLVLFSPGIRERDETMIGGDMIASRSRYLDPALSALNAANVAVYGVQLQKNVDISPVFHQRLSEISDTTGGQYFPMNVNFRPALEKIENTNSGYYLLSYRTPHSSGTKGFQKVDVSVKNPEFKVVARSGYQYGG